MSFMRGIVENTIKSMSPEERESALKSVTQQVVSMMSEAERVGALFDIVSALTRDLPQEQIDQVVEQLRR